MDGGFLQAWTNNTNEGGPSFNMSYLVDGLIRSYGGGHIRITMTSKASKFFFNFERGDYIYV